jgi:MOSC domain-containing protein YiiM
MFRGKLVGIYTASGPGEPMIANPSIRALEGIGLEGDRYAAKAGKFSDRPGTGREVTLIEREAIAAVNAEGEVDLAEHKPRRNLVTEGVPLNHLVGRTFRVGDVLLRGCRISEPCAYLASLTSPGVSRALVHRGGLRAEIVEGGVIRTGDEITEIEVGEAAARA